MTSAAPSGILSFFTQLPGRPDLPLNNFLMTTGTGSSDLVVDGNSDGNADTGIDFLGDPADPGQFYTGYTINLGGHEYAIFSTAISNSVFRIPYFNSFENLSGLQGTAVPMTFTLSGSDANVVNLFCFVGGTQIATPEGERAVEDLAIGDLVVTAGGRAVPVKWLGRQAIHKAAVNIAMDERLAPVCIGAGMLGNHSDLYVSADHGMIIDGMVVNASALVNHDTIRFVPSAEMPASFTYYHIETDAHDVILANGAPAETFLDIAGRAAFDNHKDYLDLYGAERLISEMDRPRISSVRLLPGAIRARLGIEDAWEYMPKFGA